MAVVCDQRIVAEITCAHFPGDVCPKYFTVIQQNWYLSEHIFRLTSSTTFSHGHLMSFQVHLYYLYKPRIIYIACVHLCLSITLSIDVWKVMGDLRSDMKSETLVGILSG